MSDAARAAHDADMEKAVKYLMHTATEVYGRHGDIFMHELMTRLIAEANAKMRRIENDALQADLAKQDRQR